MVHFLKYVLNQIDLKLHRKGGKKNDGNSVPVCAFGKTKENHFITLSVRPVLFLSLLHAHFVSL